MSIAVAAEVARWTGVSAGNGDTFVSGTFTPANNSLLVIAVEADTNSTEDGPVSVSGGGLTWTKQVERLGLESTAGGMSTIWTAPVVTGASMAITITRTAAVTVAGRITGHGWIVTGYDTGTPVDTVGANNEGGSGTNNLNTTSLTPPSNGLLLVADCEWAELGSFEASSNLTQDSQDYPGQISVCDGYRACSSGVSVSANLNAAGTGTAQHKWCQIVVREATAAGGGFVPYQPNYLVAPMLAQ